MHGPDEHEGWAWAFGTSFVGAGILGLLGLTDRPADGVAGAQLRAAESARLLGGPKMEQLEAQMREWLRALDAALREVEGIPSVRWYDQGTFDVDHGATWFDTPMD